jgi:hypothetical protein
MLLLAMPVAAGPTPTVSPSPSPVQLIESASPTSPQDKAIRTATVWLKLYDLDHRASALYSPNGREVIPAGEHIEFVFKDGSSQTIPYLDGSVSTDKPDGAPFLFRVYSPQFGYILGFSRVGIGWPAFFHVPVKGSEVGLSGIYSQLYTGPRDPFTGIDIPPLIADDHLQPTYSTFAQTLPNNLPLVSRATAIYEEGNALHDLGLESDRFGTATINTYPSLSAVWGDYPALYSTEVGFFREAAPVGPLKLVVSCDGYGSDEVNFTVQDRVTYMWRPLLSPATREINQSGPTPSELMNMIALTPEEGDFIRETALREKLLGQSRLFTNLAKASDANGDGCIDAADYQVVVDRMAPEAR